MHFCVLSVIYKKQRFIMCIILKMSHTVIFCNTKFNTEYIFNLGIFICFPDAMINNLREAFYKLIFTHPKFTQS